MLALGIADGAWAGVGAVYSILHVPQAEVAAALRELQRALQPGGWLLLAFHLGSGVTNLYKWWGQPVSVDFTYFQASEMLGYVEPSGFEIVEAVERDTYPDVEAQTRRAYLLARKPRAPAQTGS